MSLGIAISTYFTKHLIETNRFISFKTSISSLILSGFIGKIVLVDDGSEIKTHLEWIKSKWPSIIIVERQTNGGISKTKNTCIKSLIENNIEFGFLADDDLLYKKPNWWNIYFNAYRQTNIPHFCFTFYFKHQLETFNKISLHKYQKWCNGILLTFTPQLIKDIGYFKIFSHKYGNEHINFSNRCIFHGKIPYMCDVVNSKDYLGCINTKSVYTKTYKDNGTKLNYEDAFKDHHIIEPLIE